MLVDEKLLFSLFILELFTEHLHCKSKPTIYVFFLNLNE